VFWLIPLPHLAGPSEALEEFAKQIHLVVSLGLAVLVAVHTGAALWHHLIARDDVLRRMLPQWKGEP
jgi:cytochrome b561